MLFHISSINRERISSVLLIGFHGVGLLIAINQFGSNIQSAFVMMVFVSLIAGIVYGIINPQKIKDTFVIGGGMYFFGVAYYSIAEINTCAGFDCAEIYISLPFIALYYLIIGGSLTLLGSFVGSIFGFYINPDPNNRFAQIKRKIVNKNKPEYQEILGDGLYPDFNQRSKKNKLKK